MQLCPLWHDAAALSQGDGLETRGETRATGLLPGLMLAQCGSNPNPPQGHAAWVRRGAHTSEGLG
jgi:hypothetical protein